MKVLYCYINKEGGNKMVKEKIISTAGSFKGWNFATWFKGNWKTLKEIIKVGVPLIIGLLATPNPALVALITAAGKLLIDSGEYFFSTIKVK